MLGNIITNLLNFITNHHDDTERHDEESDIFSRHKRITSDEGIKAVGLEARGFRNGEFDDQVEQEYRRSTDENFENFLNSELEDNAHKQMKGRSILDDDLIDNSMKTKFIERSATLTSKNKAEDDEEKISLKTEEKIRTSRSGFEKVNSREEKEMTSVKTLSSLSVPANSNSGSGSGEEDSTLTEGNIYYFFL